MKKIGIILSILGFTIGTGFINALAYMYCISCYGFFPSSFPVWT